MRRVRRVRRVWRARRIAAIVAGVVATPLVLAAAVVLVLTNTDVGRNQVRRFVIHALGPVIHGHVTIGHLGGNLLRGVTADSVAITDSAGAPFVAARHVSVRYHLRDFLHQRIAGRSVRVDDPVVVLDQAPDGRWNVARLFASTHRSDGDTTHGGWGSWIVFTDVQVTNARVLIRRPWTPDSILAGEARDSAIRVALGPRSRAVVVATAHGYQQVIEADHLTTTVTRLDLADPATPVRTAAVARLTTALALFRGPVAQVTDLHALVHLTGDSLWITGAEVALPASHVERVSARVIFHPTEITLAAHAAPVALADLAFLEPRLPTDGRATGALTVRWTDAGQDFHVTGLEAVTGPTRASGEVEVRLGTEFALQHTTLAFSDLDTRLIRRFVPSLRTPVPGAFSGRVAIDGTVRAATVDAEIGFVDARRGTRSHITMTGTAGVHDGIRDGAPRGPRVVVARGVAIGLDSLPLALVRLVRPGLPLHGTLTGAIHLDGATDTQMAVDADIVHHAGRETSHLQLDGSARFAGQPVGHPWIDATLAATPLAVRTTGRFAPSLGLRGLATGRVRAVGDLGDLTVTGRFRVSPDTVSAAFAADTTGTDSTGRVRIDGHFDLAAPGRNYGYDATVAVTLVDASVVSSRAPPTTLTATVTAAGRGIDPATMRATASARITTSTIDSVTIDSATVRVAASGGVLEVDTARLRVPAASAELTGAIGLARDRRGTLHYRIAIDSLSAIRRWIPSTDTSRALATERRFVEAVQRARGDRPRTPLPTPTTRQQVEAAVAGAPLDSVVASASPISPTRDTAAIRHNLLHGRVDADGTLAGSIQRFDVRGSATAADVIALGASFERARAEYAWIAAPDLAAPIVVGVQLDTVALGSFALDSIDARVVYRKPAGALVLLVRQRGLPSVPGGPPTHDQEYTVNADLSVDPSGDTLEIESVAMRFDTTFWSAKAPALITWGATGVSVRGLSLTDGTDGHIIVSGTIPATGSGELHVDIAHFAVGDLTALLESRVLVRGDLSLTADVDGTIAAPRFTGTVTTAAAAWDGIAVPDLASRFAYDGTTLDAHGTMAVPGGRTFARIDGRLPMHLGKLADTSASRFPADGPVSVDVDADSIPFELIPEFVGTIADLHGHGTAKVHWGGSIRKPELSGTIAVDHGTVSIVPLGIRLTDIGVRVHGVNDSVTVDSIVARSRGPIRITGFVDLSTPSIPVLSLVQTARGARVINTQERGWAIVTDSLNVDGPLMAAYLTGRLHVTDGVFYIPDVGGRSPIDVTDPAVYSVADTTIGDVRKAIPSPNTITRNLLMDVDVQVDPQVWVRNKDANVEVSTDGDLILRTDREAHAIVLDGVVNSERGQYTFLTKRFDITKGTANFIGTADFDPTIQANATYAVQTPTGQALNIQIVIAGTAQKPRITLTSDAQPPLSQSDLIAYLALGSSSSSLLSQGSGGGGASSAGSPFYTTDYATYLQEKLATLALGTFTQDLQGNLARTLDADVFNITAGDTPIGTYSNSTLNQFLYGTQLEFGKYWTPTTYVALEARAANWGQSPPGALVQTRIARFTTLEATYQPVFLLQTPDLTLNQINPTKVFGLFVVRDWRF